MTVYVNSFNENCNINTSLIEQAKIIAGHMHETGEAEDALVWLMDELDAFLFWTRERALDACFDEFIKNHNSLAAVEDKSASA